MELMEKKQYNGEIGKRLRVLRVIKGFTQDEMAEKLDISTRQYRRYESGDSVFQVKAFGLLGKIKGIDLQYLISGQTLNDKIVEWSFSRMPEEEYQQNQNNVNKLQEYINSEKYDKAITFGKEILIPIYEYYDDNIFNSECVQIRNVEKCKIITELLEERYRKLCLKARKH